MVEGRLEGGEKGEIEVDDARRLAMETADRVERAASPKPACLTGQSFEPRRQQQRQRRSQQTGGRGDAEEDGTQSMKKKKKKKFSYLCSPKIRTSTDLSSIQPHQSLADDCSSSTRLATAVEPDDSVDTWR